MQFAQFCLHGFIVWSSNKPTHSAICTASPILFQYWENAENHKTVNLNYNSQELSWFFPGCLKGAGFIKWDWYSDAAKANIQKLDKRLFS